MTQTKFNLQKRIMCEKLVIFCEYGGISVMGTFIISGRFLWFFNSFVTLISSSQSGLNYAALR